MNIRLHRKYTGRSGQMSCNEQYKNILFETLCLPHKSTLALIYPIIQTKQLYIYVV